MRKHEVFSLMRGVLADVYPDEESARIVAKDAGLDLRLIKRSTRAIDNWDAILEEADNSGRVLGLLDLAVNRYSENEQLAEARNAYAEWSKARREAECDTREPDRQASARLREEKERRFQEDYRRYGVMADSASMSHKLNADGSAEFTFRLDSLKVEDGHLEGVYFSFETPASLVGAPVPDRDAERLHIRWDPEPAPEPADMEAMMDRQRSVRGTFRFAERLTRHKRSYTFGWRIKVLNSHAITMWDYQNLYSEQQQKHVYGKRYSPTEYFARLVWFPIRKLEMAMEIGWAQAAPQLRYFQFTGAPIPKEEVIAGEKSKDGMDEQVLRSFPRKGTQWYKQNAKWEADVDTERLERVALQDKDNLGWQLVIDYPFVGSFYSLDWQPLDRPIGDFERFIRGAREVRRQLLEHRKRKRNRSRTALSDKIGALFDAMHKKLKDAFWCRAEGEIFQTGLMTYDDSQRKLWIVEGRLNDGDLSDDWSNFWLPFGVGLAGACFRRGAGAFTYSSSLGDLRTASAPEYYLPAPGSIPYEFLLALPIDHPQLDEEMSIDDANRSRQLIGVLTIGSNSGASPLGQFCGVPLTEDIIQRLANLRVDCQRLCDEICHHLLPGLSEP